MQEPYRVGQDPRLRHSDHRGVGPAERGGVRAKAARRAGQAVQQGGLRAPSASNLRGPHAGAGEAGKTATAVAIDAWIATAVAWGCLLVQQKGLAVDPFTTRLHPQLALMVLQA